MKIVANVFGAIILIEATITAFNNKFTFEQTALLLIIAMIFFILADLADIKGRLK
jgi:uncharacterized membrane protein YGL010W